MSGTNNASRIWKGTLALGLIVVLDAQVSGAIAKSGALDTPPGLDYRKLCKSAQIPLPLAVDWVAWDGKSVDVPLERMLADAVHLVDGGTVVTRNLPVARAMFEYLASVGGTIAAEAKRQLAALLLDTRSGATDRMKAGQLLAEAARSQPASAGVTLGRLIREGELPDFTTEHAAGYLSRAVGMGEPSAAMELATLYRSGKVALPFEGAVEHFEMLAAITAQTMLSSGDCSVAANVGRYLLDQGDEASASKAIAWFEIAAAAGDRSALMQLARSYDKGVGASADPEKAQEFWKQALDGGEPDAIVPVARPLLEQGRESETALKWLDIGMANGEPDAFLLAARNARGDYSGVADFDLMQAILREAAGKPDVSVYTLDVLANSYAAGQGVAQDLAKADEIYQRMQASGSADAEALYGRFLVKRGRDLEQGIAHLQTAVRAGSETARFTLASVAACMPSAGIDSRALMNSAADAGNPAALRVLARQAIENGDTAKAISYLESAVAKGDRPAIVERASLAIAAGEDSRRINKWIEAAAAPGDNVVTGRITLVKALRAGELGEDGGRSADLLRSVAASSVAEVDLLIASAILAEGPLDESQWTDVQARLTRAANGGEPEAMLLLSRFLLTARGDLAGSSEWLLRAGEAGSVEALAEVPTDEATLTRLLPRLDNLAACDTGLLLQKARLERLNGKENAAEQTLAFAERQTTGHPREGYALARGILALSPRGAGDFERVAQLYQKSAEGGYARAALVLAKFYDSGQLGARTSDAIEWYRKAAMSGETAPIKELARHAAGGADPEAQQALKALKSIADGDNTIAMRTYGTVLAEQGSGTNEGIAFLQRAADRGDIPAMKTLAWHYAAGVNGDVSAVESARWMRKAAEEGDSEAMYRYAVALDLGFGVDPDPTSAKTWHERAEKNGFVQ